MKLTNTQQKDSGDNICRDCFFGVSTIGDKNLCQRVRNSQIAEFPFS